MKKEEKVIPRNVKVKCDSETFNTSVRTGILDEVQDPLPFQSEWGSESLQKGSQIDRSEPLSVGVLLSWMCPTEVCWGFDFDSLDFDLSQNTLVDQGRSWEHGSVSTTVPGSSVPSFCRIRSSVVHRVRVYVSLFLYFTSASPPANSEVVGRRTKLVTRVVVRWHRFFGPRSVVGTVRTRTDNSKRVERIRGGGVRGRVIPQKVLDLMDLLSNPEKFCD